MTHIGKKHRLCRVGGICIGLCALYLIDGYLELSGHVIEGMGEIADLAGFQIFSDSIRQVSGTKALCAGFQALQAGIGGSDEDHDQNEGNSYRRNKADYGNAVGQCDGAINSIRPLNGQKFLSLIEFPQPLDGVIEVDR